MGWITALAVYFIIWWTVLFVILPIGQRSQEEDGEIVLGSDHGAPTNFSFSRKALHTTWVSFIVFAAFYWVTFVFGMGLESFPNFLPGIHPAAAAPV